MVAAIETRVDESLVEDVRIGGDEVHEGAGGIGGQGRKWRAEDSAAPLLVG